MQISHPWRTDIDQQRLELPLGVEQPRITGVPEHLPCKINSLINYEKSFMSRRSKPTTISACVSASLLRSPQG